MSGNAIDLFAGLNVAPPTAAGQVLNSTGAGAGAWTNAPTIAGLLTTQLGITNSGAAITATSTNVTTTGLGVVTASGGFNAGVGGLDVPAVGQGVAVKEGSNAKQGTAVLVAGTLVVANTSVTNNSRIMLTGQSLGTVAVFSAYGVSARTAGTSFTILASQGTDTSVVAYEIFEPG